MAEINVTPMVDVMLVLLIIFMVTAPLLVAGVPVNLPEARAKALDQDQKPVAISLDADGRLFVNDAEVSNADLPDTLTGIALLAALRSGELHAVTRQDCRREWQLVLDYRHLPPRALLAETRAEFDSLIHCRDDLPALDEVKLPICSDPDDQKFLETAWQAGARYLITKDKALLKLARKTARNGWFDIIQPQAWPPAAPAAAAPD